MGLDRVFITGVSPVVLRDMISGYNVGENMYLLPRFKDLCGFTEAEVVRMRVQLATEGRPARILSVKKVHDYARPVNPS